MTHHMSTMDIQFSKMQRVNTGVTGEIFTDELSIFKQGVVGGPISEEFGSAQRFRQKFNTRKLLGDE